MPVVVIMGPSGCGKSTIGKALSKTMNAPFYDGDDYHPKANIDKMCAGIALNDADRAGWLTQLRQNIQTWLAENALTFLACSALKHQYQAALGVDQVQVITLFLKGDKQTLSQRLQARENHFMPESLLDSQLSILEPPKGGVLVDIDASVEQITEQATAKLLKHIQTLNQS